MSEEEYKIELTVKKRLCQGKTEYLIKCKGDTDDYMWEPVANLDWDELIEEYEVESSKNKKFSEVEKEYRAKWLGWDFHSKDNAWRPVVSHHDYKWLIEEYETTRAGDFEKMKIKIDKIMAEQVKVVGSVGLYEKIHNNFLEEKFEPFFAKEQYDLYRWRADFFCSNFPFPTSSENNWYTDGGDDTHGFDTLPLNITKHFDRVLMLACIPPYHPHGKVWFDNDEDTANSVQGLYDLSFVEFNDSLFDKEYLEKEGLGYSEVAHMIVLAFQTGPLKLEHLAMKKVLEYQIPLDEVPKELKVKDVVGIFDGNEDITD